MDTPENRPDQPSKAEQHLERAYAYEVAEDFENALRECDSAIRFAPDSTEAHNLRGIILEELNRKEEAAAAYRKAIRLDSAFQDAEENLLELETELRDEKAKAAPSVPGARQDWTDDYRLSIDTPENVIFDYDIAGIGSRFLAALVDTLIIVALQVVVTLALVLLLNIIQVWDSTVGVNNPLVAWLVAMLGLVAFAFLWGYYVFFEVLWNGQSPGKRWVGLRVIRTDGTPITFTESLVRNLVRLVDFLPAYYGVGVVAMFIDARSRRLGDLAAGTLVVHDRESVTLESLRAEPVRRSLARVETAPSAALPIERLTLQDIQMAEEFLRRQDQMSYSTATAVAHRIARALLKRMEVPAEEADPISDQDLILKTVHLYHTREE